MCKSVILIKLCSSFGWICSSVRVFFCIIALYFQRIFPLDWFWVTASVKIIIIVSFIGATFKLCMCFREWMIVSVVILYNNFYYIIILKALYFYYKNLNIVCKKTWYKLCRYKMKFDKDMSQNAKFQKCVMINQKNALWINFISCWLLYSLQ